MKICIHTRMKSEAWLGVVHEDQAEKKTAAGVAKMIFNAFQRRLSISVYGTIFVILIIFEC